MQTLRNVTLAGCLGICTLLCIHIVGSTIAYAFALSRPTVASSRDSNRHLWPQEASPNFSTEIRNIASYSTYSYEVWLRHWRSGFGEVPVAYTSTLFRSHARAGSVITVVVATGESTEPPTLETIPSFQGNYNGWLIRDLEWVTSWGWVLYIVAAFAGVATRYRHLLTDLLRSAKQRVDRFDQVIEELNRT